jgi:hypothetical protein
VNGIIEQEKRKRQPEKWKFITLAGKMQSRRRHWRKLFPPGIRIYKDS